MKASTNNNRHLPVDDAWNGKPIIYDGAAKEREINPFFRSHSFQTWTQLASNIAKKKLECCIKSTIATYAIDWCDINGIPKQEVEEWNWILNSQTSACENEWDKWEFACDATIYGGGCVACFAKITIISFLNEILNNSKCNFCKTPISSTCIRFELSLKCETLQYTQICSERDAMLLTPMRKGKITRWD